MSWESGHYPGVNMYAGTCSEDPSCGFCGKVSTGDKAFDCGYFGVKEPEKNCTPTCSQIDCPCSQNLLSTSAALSDAINDWPDSEKVLGSIVDWDVSRVTSFEKRKSSSVVVIKH